MRGDPKPSDVKVLGVSGSAVYVAVLNRFAGKRERYTLWRLSGSDAQLRGDELSLGHCRRLAAEVGAR